MNRWSILVRVALLAMLLFLAACQRPPKLSPLHEGSVILAFGDSLTHGTGASAELSYPAQLQPLVPGRVIASGVPGEVSSQGLVRLAKELERHRPDLVILCHGGNDILRRQDVSKTAQNLRTMIQMIHDQGAEVVLLGVPRPGLFLSAADFYPELAREIAIPIEEKIIPSVLSDNSLKSDQIHPNAQGYEQIARAVAELLKDSGAL